MTIQHSSRGRAHSPGDRPPYLVFSDVDETLVSGKSMFDFHRFHLTHRHGLRGEGDFRLIWDGLLAASAAGESRAEVNRRYYRHYTGEDAAELARLGRHWFARYGAEPGFFIEDTLAALRRHRAAGAEIVLVSGSFPACLTPIAEFVDASHLLCTDPVLADGRYTGEITEPVIGEGKRSAVLALLADYPDVDPADCFAYGDHPSDLPLLECVGHPTVVGDHPELLRLMSLRSTLPVRNQR